MVLVHHYSPQGGKLTDLIPVCTISHNDRCHAHQLAISQQQAGHVAITSRVELQSSCVQNKLQPTAVYPAVYHQTLELSLLLIVFILFLYLTGGDVNGIKVCIKH